MTRPGLRIGVVSLGCAKNLVDTEVMLGHLDRAGCSFVRDPSEADVVVVNTCGFIEPAREESVRAILEAAEWKKTGRLRTLVVAGCLVQRHRDELAREIPEVDAFIGLDELHAVVAAAGAAQFAPLGSPALPVVPARAPADAPWLQSTWLYDDATPRRTATPPWTAFVKIAEGCDHTCSFCSIPSFRGRFRSRQLDSVAREVEALAARGVREVNLIAQDSSHYGRDLGMRDGLADLLVRLDRVEALRWIRLHYLYPNTITPHLIDTIAAAERVVPYVDLPLQHAHPDVLRRMRRGSDAEAHLELLGRFRSVVPGVALRTTLIVGFPGETDAEFDALLEFVRAARFDHLGVFEYSHEPATTAHALDDDVPAAIKRERRERVMACQQEIAFDIVRRGVGRIAEAVMEGAHPETEHLLVARLAVQAPDVDGQVLIQDGFAEPGSFVRVELTDAAGYDWVGRVVGPA